MTKAETNIMENQKLLRTHLALGQSVFLITPQECQE